MSKVKQHEWQLLGNGQTIVPNGSSVLATVPNGTERVQIASEGGSAYYNIGGGIASALSPGFVGTGERVFEGPLRGLNALAVFAAAGATAIHIQYYQYNRGH